MSDSESIAFVLASILAIVFAASTIPKVLEPGHFAEVVSRHGVLPQRFSSPIAMVIVLLQAFVSIGVFVPSLVRAALIVSIALLAIFFFVMWINARRPQPIPCFCFGTDDSDLGSGKVILRILVIFAVAITALIFAPS